MPIARMDRAVSVVVVVVVVVVVGCSRIAILVAITQSHLLPLYVCTTLTIKWHARHRCLSSRDPQEYAHGWRVCFLVSVGLQFSNADIVGANLIIKSNTQKGNYF